MTPDIFLSYAREDTSRARELVRILEKEGWSVWWDKEIVPGQDFELEIDKALADAKAVLVMWSSFSVSSTWVRIEANEAKKSNKLIPILLDNARIPLAYRSLSTIELMDWPDKLCSLDLVSLKTAVARVINNDSSLQYIPEPNNSNELTLSQRVATRVADMLSADKNNQSNLGSLKKIYSIEKCISEYLLVLLRDHNSDVIFLLDRFLNKLGSTLGNVVPIYASVDFSSSSVENVHAGGTHEISGTVHKKILSLVNELCSADFEHNLNYDPNVWPITEVICLPLQGNREIRHFAWFLNDHKLDDWTLAIQERLMELSFVLKQIGED